jgi:replication factor C small subunit
MNDDPLLEIPWVEKYRPQVFEDIISQNLAINNLKRFIKSESIPHMIFTGPAGTGKTSAALILANKILGNNCRENGFLLELNASDSVRMNYVRNILKKFVNQSTFLLNSEKNAKKMVILDEADNIPGTVQQALRRIIEKSSGSVIFILLCNYINRIIDPIISRCAVLRFAPLTKEKMIERLKFIIEKEKIKINNQDALLDILVFISEGDLRKAINTLQMSVALKIIDDLSLNEIYTISGYVEQDIIDNLFIALKNKEIEKIRVFFKDNKVFTSRNLIKQLLLKISQEKNFDNNTLAKIYNYFGDYEFRITQGSDSEIQLNTLLYAISWEM